MANDRNKVATAGVLADGVSMIGNYKVLSATLVLSFAVAGAFAQNSPGITEVRSLLREAGKLIPEIEEFQQSSAASNIAGQQVLAGDLAGALETVHSVKKPQDSAASYGFDYYGIAWTLSKTGSWRVAMDLVRDLPDDDSKAIDYLGIAESLAARGDFEHALVAARAIPTIPKASSRFADTLVDVCSQQFKAGEGTAATAILKEALEAVESEQNNAQGSGYTAAMWYPGAIQRLVDVGNTAAASMVLERLHRAAAEEKDPSRKAQLLRYLAASQARVGDFTAALLTARGLGEREQHDAAMLIIAGEQARQGDAAGARRLVADLSAKSWSNLAVEEFAEVLSKSGDSVGALDTVKRIPAPEDRAYVLAQLALQQAGRNEGGAALTAILAMENAHRAGDAVNPFVFELIAVTRGILGDFPGARQIVSNLSDEHSVWPLWNLTEQLVEAGKKSDAVALAYAQEFPRARAYALLGTATSMLERIEAERTHK
jgi:tetratricopeptide (TPR) repeat protein